MRENVTCYQIFQEHVSHSSAKFLVEASTTCCWINKISDLNFNLLRDYLTNIVIVNYKSNIVWAPNKIRKRFTWKLHRYMPLSLNTKENHFILFTRTLQLFFNMIRIMQLFLVFLTFRNNWFKSIIIWFKSGGLWFKSHITLHLIRIICKWVKKIESLLFQLFAHLTHYMHWP